MLRFTNVDHQSTRLPPIYAYRTHPLLSLREALDPIRPRIDQLDDFIDIAKTACHFPSEHGLTHEESASIYLYTMDCGEKSLYRLLNQELRVKDRSVLVPWYGYLKLFDTALKKLPSLKMNLWRGIDRDISKNFKEGEELIWWYLNSCSSSVKVIKQFLGSVSTLFMIEAKNAKCISAYSSFPDENEVILGLGTRLRVVSDPLDHPSLNVVHLLELIGETTADITSNLTTIAMIQPLENDLVSKINNKLSTSITQNYPDGCRYEGEQNNGKKHGKGTYTYADGRKYTGDWVDGKRTGNGVLTLANGDRYEKNNS